MLEQAATVTRQQGLEIEASILEDAIKKRTFTKKPTPHTHRMKPKTIALIVTISLIAGALGGEYATRILLGYDKTQFDIECVLFKAHLDTAAASAKAAKDLNEGKANIVALWQTHLVETHYATVDPKTGQFRMLTLAEISAASGLSEASKTVSPLASK